LVKIKSDILTARNTVDKTVSPPIEINKSFKENEKVNFDRLNKKLSFISKSKETSIFSKNPPSLGTSFIKSAENIHNITTTKKRSPSYLGPTKNSLNNKPTSIFSPAFRDYKTTFLIDKQIKKEKLDKELIKRFDSKENSVSHDSLENDDKVDLIEYEKQKQKNILRDFMHKKLDVVNKNFESGVNLMLENKIEDKVNYFSDVFSIPHLKNNLTNSKSHDSFSTINNMKIDKNKINRSINIYLNSLRIKYQRDKDEVKSVSKKDTKIFDNRIKETFSKFHRNTADNFNYRVDFDISNYIIHKYENYNKTDICKTKEKDVIKAAIIKDYKKHKTRRALGSFLSEIIKVKFIEEE
jgi:hypothetical protein